MTKFIDEVKLKIIGHVKMFEYEDRSQVGTDTGRVILDKYNAVHPENMSILVARAVANRENGAIHSMYFGTGGATIDPLGNVQYASPNTTGAADLHVPVYFEVIDDTDNAPAGNQLAVRHIGGTLFSDVEARCILDKDEPFGQPLTDNVGPTNLNTDQFVFDEIGLKTADGLLVTHIVFTPIQKASNRIIEVVYLLRYRIIV